MLSTETELNLNFPAFLKRFRMPILFMTNTLTR